MRKLYSIALLMFVQWITAQNANYRIAYQAGTNIKEKIVTILPDHVGEITYSYAFSEDRLQEMEKQAIKLNGHSQSIDNIRHTFDIQYINISKEKEKTLVDWLENQPDIRHYEKINQQIIPPPFDIAPTTPDYTNSQLYIYENPGVNMAYAWELGYNGQNVKVKNVEAGFNVNHEEFNDSPHIKFLENYTAIIYENYWEHGTATFGVLAAHNGNYGVTGMAHGIEEAVLISEYTEEYGYNRAMAVSLAIQESAPGEIILYELQTFGAAATQDSPNYVVAEYENSIWDLTKAATDTGIVIIAAAGNGNQNLDAPEYANYMQRGNSGAIIVGAGTPDTNHARAGFSTYGSRVDLQGWGYNVLSTGYGNFALIGNDNNQAYIMFSGTSSATPIVASCAAVLQSYYFDHTDEYLTGAQILDILSSTGTPQWASDTKNIGPLPNMESALAVALSNDVPLQKRFRVYPNPFDDEFNIKVLSNTATTNMWLYDVSGKLIDHQIFTDNITIPMHSLSPGMYFVKLSNDEKTETIKLIKK